MMNNPVSPHFVGKDLIWSLEPIVLLMKAIGINIKRQGMIKSSSFLKRCAFYLYSLAWLVFSLSCFIATGLVCFDVIQPSIISNLKRNHTFNLSNAIDRAVHSGKH